MRVLPEDAVALRWGMREEGACFAVKTAIDEVDRAAFVFAAIKTMYGGKAIAVGDRAYLFASENEGGAGLFACGIVSAAMSLPRVAGIIRQTPRVTVSVAVTERAREPLGRGELRAWRGKEGAQAELDFKLYRQATNKIVGLSADAAAFLDTLF